MKRAIELNPGYGLGHQWYAHLLESSGRLDEALKELRLAQELDPLSPSVYAALAQTYYFKRDYDQAIASSNEALEKYPNFVLAYINLGRAYLGKKMYSEAIAALQKASELSHEGPGSTTALGYAYALAGKRPEAEEMLAHLNDLSRKRFVSSLYFAAIYNGLADKDKAFEYLERARQERSEYLVYLRQDPWSDSLQSDPRFEQVMRQVGF
jgi:tetratricopeptide (TPR) repeat protein